MNHRSVIKFLIVVVIVVTVIWSVANVHDYAAHFHSGPMVWTLGLSVGMANALSVYAYVIARTPRVRLAAGTGIVLFGVMSASLQMFLYLVNGAPLLAAIAFGWFGPVAEGVLSWLHASLSEEQAPAKASKQAQASASKQQAQASRQQAPQVQPQPQADGLTLQQVASMKDQAIADLVGVRRQSVNLWRNGGTLESKILERLPQLSTVSSNGKDHI